VKLLLDTQVLFWWYSEPAKISKRVISLMEDSENQILVSAAIAWELAIKAVIGKLDALSLTLDLPRLLAEDGFSELPIGITQATRAGLLPLHHRDPFDRLLVAQAQDLNVPVLSSDHLLDSYDVKRIW
jgi:PIN domain nuclease of toxin-antitoxin system